MPESDFADASKSLDETIRSNRETTAANIETLKQWTTHLSKCLKTFYGSRSAHGDAFMSGKNNLVVDLGVRPGPRRGTSGIVALSGPKLIVSAEPDGKFYFARRSTWEDADRAARLDSFEPQPDLTIDSLERIVLQLVVDGELAYSRIP